ncbi:hypothetical protein L195_g008953 [Trifolium pratense]|uniref:Uncharacterized protein n=1 Tax=Trifolium pratense TaxID=57577 RepID=A0A2K3PAQ3_TRIPR|nr:hypothetical protein L195_g008953 [Trifolium pratense]
MWDFKQTPTTQTTYSTILNCKTSFPYSVELRLSIIQKDNEEIKVQLAKQDITLKEHSEAIRAQTQTTAEMKEILAKILDKLSSESSQP